MRVVLQRVRNASVTVGGREVAQIGQGLLALAGFSATDLTGEPGFERMAKRILGLRIFDDANGRLNLSLDEINGGLLLVSQVTLTASLTKGSRPSFHTAAPVEAARILFETFAQTVNRLFPRVQTGRFQAHMVVALENDGPVTFVLDDP